MGGWPRSQEEFYLAAGAPGVAAVNMSPWKAMALSLRGDRYGRESVAAQKHKLANREPSRQIVSLRGVKKAVKLRLEADRKAWIRA